jgi:membrane protein
MSLLIIGPPLLVGFIGLSHAAVSGPLGTHLSGLPLAQQLKGLLIVLSPYVMVTGLFTVLYMFVPNTRVQWRPALIGALAAGVLWAMVGKIFTAFVVVSTRLTIVYAGFAFIVAALLWTYFGWLILLAGAQLSFYIQNPTYLRIGLQEVRLSCAEIEQLAMRAMYLVGRTHMEGGPRWTINRLASELGLPGVAIAQIGAALEKSGLLIVTEDDEFVPGRDVGRITVQEILDVARNQRSGHFAARGREIAPVDRLSDRLEAAWRECCAGRTLRDLIEEPV